jgi:hypothetical protein
MSSAPSKTTWNASNGLPTLSGGSEKALALIQLYWEASPLPPRMPGSKCREILYSEELSEADRDLWFPDKYGKRAVGTRSPQDTARLSKNICNGTGEHAEAGPCPHREACGLWAVREGERFGVWGGMSERERMHLRRRMGVEADRRKAKTSDVSRNMWAGRQSWWAQVRPDEDLSRCPDWLEFPGRRHSRYAAVAGRFYEVCVQAADWQVQVIRPDGEVLEVLAKVSGPTPKARRKAAAQVISLHALARGVRAG